MTTPSLWRALPAVLFYGLFALGSSHALAQSPTIDDATRTRIETVLKQESCLDYAQISMSEWNRILDRFVVDTASERHLLTRFNATKSLHVPVLESLTTFAKATLSEGSTPSELSASLETLKKQYSDLNEQMNASRAADEKFLQLAMEAERSFVDINDILMKAPDTCDAKTIATLKAQGSAADGRRTEITLARKYVSDAGIKREKMLSLSYAIRRNALLSAHAKATKQSLLAVKSQIEGILKLGDLLPEFIRWRSSRSLRGLADGEITHYMQYESSLAVIDEDIRIAQKYRAKFSAIEGITPAMRDGALREVDGFVQAQGKIRAEQEAMGWKGHLDRQRFLVSAMLNIKDKYPQNCGPMLEVFNRNTTDVNDIFAYRSHEAFYRSLMDVCSPFPEGLK